MINIIQNTIGSLQRGSSFTGLLDTYSGASVAFSFRKLRAANDRNCINVRRSVDNASQDIGFSNNVLDTASLLTFVGAGDGFVTKMYSQGVDANDAIQVTAVDQTKIVIGGVLQLLNGKTTIIDTITSNYTIPNLTSGASDSWLFAVVKNDDTTRIMVADNASPPYYNRSQDDASSSSYNGTEPTLYINGSELTAITGGDIHTATSSQVLFTSNIDLSAVNNSLSIGYNSSSFPMYKYMQEFVLYPTNQASNKGGIESNINAYYSIY